MTISRRCSCAVLLATALIGLHAIVGRASASDRPFTLRGPFTHENLTIYVVRGSPHHTRQYVTLDEGLYAGVVTVREKGAGQGRDRAEVNSLEIENRSDKWLFLQAGDIVKGGKQDRTIMTDLTLPPHAQPTAIDAFCVEHGRWTARNGLQFSDNPGLVSGGQLKRAIQGDKNQSRVWEEVAKVDARAAQAVRANGAPLAMAGSAATLSSTGTYNAIVEHPALQGTRAAFVTALLPHVQRDPNAIGLVVAINGQVTSADVYASPALFHKLSRKLLDSYATEAQLARQPDAAVAVPVKDAAIAFLMTPASARTRVDTVGSMEQKTVETDGAVRYEYAHRDASAKPVHQNYLKKE